MKKTTTVNLSFLRMVWCSNGGYDFNANLSVLFDHPPPPTIAQQTAAMVETDFIFSTSPSLGDGRFELLGLGLFGTVDTG